MNRDVIVLLEKNQYISMLTIVSVKDEISFKKQATNSQNRNMKL